MPAPIPATIDILALGLCHGLPILAAWLLLDRLDLDRERRRENQFRPPYNV